MDERCWVKKDGEDDRTRCVRAGGHDGAHRLATAEEEEAWARATAAAARAAAHADDEIIDWSARAYDFLVDYIRRSDIDEFTVEQVRWAAERSDLPEPPTSKAWGHIILRAKRERRVEKAETVSSRSPTSNSHPVALWRVARS